MKNEITEGNKLIAEFMGAKMIVEDYNGINIIKFPDESTKDLHGLKYHSSWDWLMPVINNVGDITYSDFEARERLLNISDKITWYNDVFYICPDKIEACFKAVVEFIKWYNQNKQS